MNSTTHNCFACHVTSTFAMLHNLYVQMPSIIQKTNVYKHARPTRLLSSIVMRFHQVMKCQIWLAAIVLDLRHNIDTFRSQNCRSVIVRIRMSQFLTPDFHNHMAGAINLPQYDAKRHDNGNKQVLRNRIGRNALRLKFTPQLLQSRANDCRDASVRAHLRGVWTQISKSPNVRTVQIDQSDSTNNPTFASSKSINPSQYAHVIIDAGRHPCALLEIHSTTYRITCRKHRSKMHGNRRNNSTNRFNVILLLGLATIGYSTTFNTMEDSTTVQNDLATTTQTNHVTSLQTSSHLLPTSQGIFIGGYQTEVGRIF